jgi:HEPN domain-containing protein
MPQSDKIRKLILQWLDYAEEDLGVAEYLIKEKSPYLIAVSYHSQQAAEKYLKALLVLFDIDPPKIHDLDRLLDLIEPLHPAIVQELSDITILSKYAAQIRYPVDTPPVTLEQTK